jgi:integrase
VIFRRAVEDGGVAVNPCMHLRLPAVCGRRGRIAAPKEAEALLASLPERDRPIWATALYAGQRRGELMALRWTDVDSRAASFGSSEPTSPAQRLSHRVYSITCSDLRLSVV